MRMLTGVTLAAVAAAAVLTGCSTTPPPPPPTPASLADDTSSVMAFPRETYPSATGPSDGSPIGAWRQANAAQFNDIGDAMLATSRALSQRGAPQLPDACQRMAESADRMRATLPTPDEELTTALQTLVDSMSSAASTCPSGGATSAPAGFVSDMRTAQKQFQIAQGLLAGRS